MLFRLQLSIRKLRRPYVGPVLGHHENHVRADQTVCQHMHMLCIGSPTKYHTGRTEPNIDYG